MKIQSAIFKAFFEVFFFVMTLDQCVYQVLVSSFTKLTWRTMPFLLSQASIKYESSNMEGYKEAFSSMTQPL